MEGGKGSAEHKGENCHSWLTILAMSVNSLYYFLFGVILAVVT